MTATTHCTGCGNSHAEYTCPTCGIVYVDPGRALQWEAISLVELALLRKIEAARVAWRGPDGDACFDAGDLSLHDVLDAIGRGEKPK